MKILLVILLAFNLYGCAFNEQVKETSIKVSSVETMKASELNIIGTPRFEEIIVLKGSPNLIYMCIPPREGDERIMCAILSPSQFTPCEMIPAERGFLSCGLINVKEKTVDIMAKL